MTEPTPVAARSRRCGMVRLVLVVVVASMMAAWCYVAALANLTRTQGERAPGIVRTWDPLANMYAVGDAVGRTPALAGDVNIAPVARRALRQQPLTPAALDLLTLTASARGRNTRAAALAELSAAVSRRDLSAQLVLIEVAVTRGDIADALSHYAISLTVHSEASGLLYPVLAEAIANTQIRLRIIPYLNAGSPWLLSFLFNALDRPDALPNVARLLAEARSTPPALAPTLLRRLVDAGQIDAALIALRSVPGAATPGFAETGLTRRTTDGRFGPFAWQPTTSDDVNVSFENVAVDAVQVHVFAGNGAADGASLLRRALTLAPGHYVLRDVRETDTPGRSDAVEWTVRCASDESGTLIDGPQKSRPLGAEIDFSVPTGCPVQLFTLAIAAHRDDTPIVLDLQRIAIARRAS